MDTHRRQQHHLNMGEEESISNSSNGESYVSIEVRKGVYIPKI
jgi:hypothetical protein